MRNWQLVSFAAAAPGWMIVYTDRTQEPLAGYAVVQVAGNTRCVPINTRLVLLPFDTWQAAFDEGPHVDRIYAEQPRTGNVVATI